jgi:large subunit ribosomal protein L24
MARQVIGAGGAGRRKVSGVRRLHVRKGDRVRVIRGEHTGLEGTVMEALPKQNRVVIEGVNMRKRHTRPTQANPEGGIITFEAPIHASNVMLIDPSSGNPSRTRVRKDSEGRKERIAVKSGNPIPTAS